MRYQISDDGVCPKCASCCANDTIVRYERYYDEKLGADSEHLLVSCPICKYIITLPCADAVLEEAR